jgi:hypothetical protein
MPSSLPGIDRGDRIKQDAYIYKSCWLAARIYLDFIASSVPFSAATSEGYVKELKSVIEKRTFAIIGVLYRRL